MRRMIKMCIRYLQAGTVLVFLFGSIMSAYAQECATGTMPTVPGSSVPILDPRTIPKYVTDLVIPPEMPKTGTVLFNGTNIPYYEIAVCQFRQQILPPCFYATQGGPAAQGTPVWGYGRAGDPLPGSGLPTTFNYPGFTVENLKNQTTRVKWINGLVDQNGRYLPHLLPVDQTLHWANPPGGLTRRDSHGTDPTPYTGPVPIVTHVHGSHVTPESDGYPEAWFLPNANNIPAGYAKTGTLYSQISGVPVQPGAAVFQYANDQRPATLWFHDHALGMTRLNVYAGPAAFWLIRDPNEEPEGLPGPSPKAGDAPGTKYYEIPVAFQDRSFKPDGSLFYPDNRAFFEGVRPDQELIPYAPNSDIAPIANPEFFGNMMVANGRTWPKLNVEPRRYRFRLLNGHDSRTLNLSLRVVLNPGTANETLGAEIPIYQIGAEGGYLPHVVKIQTGFSTLLPGDGSEPSPTPASAPERALLMGPAERADVVVDFSSLVGQTVRVINTGPEVPFNGFPIAPADQNDPLTTGQIMQFIVDQPVNGTDESLPPASLLLPDVAPLFPTHPDSPRRVSLNEEESAQVCVVVDPDNTIRQVPCGTPGSFRFGPTAAKLGTVDFSMGMPMGMPMMWSDKITENPLVGDTEEWWIYNFTVDAHPIHVHLVQFQVAGRLDTLDPATAIALPPEPTELGLKDTVIAYPGMITKIRAHFDIPGLYVWHCHIIEHEDNEMMRPYIIRYTPDINMDGKVDGKDLAILLAKMRERSTKPDILAYDLNGDGKVDLLDAKYLTSKLTQ